MKRKLAGIAVGCLIVLGVLTWLVWPDGGIEVEPATSNESGNAGERNTDPTASSGSEPEAEERDPSTPTPEVRGDEWDLEESRRFSDVRPGDNAPPDDGIDWRREQLKAPVTTPREPPKPNVPVWLEQTQPDEIPPEITALAEMQNRSGYWRPDGMLDPRPLPEDATRPEEDSIFSTALAMLAALKSSYSHKEGDLRSCVRQAVIFGRRMQNSDGNFALLVRDQPVLHHAAALFALLETYRASGDWVLKPVSDKGIDYLFETRNPDGGWGFKPLDEKSNVLCTGFALLALRTAEAARLDLPESRIEDVAYWMWPLRRNGYTAWGKGVEDMPGGGESSSSRHVADAVFVLTMKWGGFQTLGDWSVDAALERLRTQPTKWDGQTNSLMAWLFTSIALWEVAPENAQEWSEQVSRALEAGRVEENRGTEEMPDLVAHWNSDDWWSQKYGRVFTQAAATITLFQCRAGIASLQASESGELVMQPD